MVMMIEQRVSGPSLHFTRTHAHHIQLILILDQSGVPQMFRVQSPGSRCFMSEHRLFADQLQHYELLLWTMERELAKSKLPQRKMLKNCRLDAGV